MSAAQLGAIDQIVVHERRGVHELDGYRSPHQPLLPLRRVWRPADRLGGKDDEQGPQALAPATIVAFAWEASGAPA